MAILISQPHHYFKTLNWTTPVQANIENRGFRPLWAKIGQCIPVGHGYNILFSGPLRPLPGREVDYTIKFNGDRDLSGDGTGDRFPLAPGFNGFDIFRGGI